MLVLVNDRQREALKAAENDLDRFEREVEDGEDVLTNPGDPLNASVAEPGTALAILLIGGILLWIRRRPHLPSPQTSPKPFSTILPSTKAGKRR